MQYRHDGDVLDRRGTPAVLSATDLLDTADGLAGSPDGEATRGTELPAVLHALRRIDRAVVDTAGDLGAVNPALSR